MSGVVDSELNTLANLRAPFLGFAVGAVLLGVTVLQAYQYFLHYWRDSKARKLTICTVCVLDCLHFAFSAAMMYSSFTSPLKYADPNVLWSLKAMATVKALLIVLVQGFYLHLIWVFAGSLFLRSSIVILLKLFSVFVITYALGVAAAFLTALEQISNISDFPLAFERMIYVGFGSTAAIDTCTAIIMSCILWPSPGGKKGRTVMTRLVAFFVGTGILTAIAALATVAVYTVNRSSILYLGIEFSVSRLYANSILVLFNSKQCLNKQLETSDICNDIEFSKALEFAQLMEPTGSIEDSPSINLPLSPTSPIVEAKDV